VVFREEVRGSACRPEAEEGEDMETVTYEILEKAVGGTAVGFRSVTRLEPLGGPGDKLFPPTFGDSARLPTPVGEDREERRRTKYAVEWRRIGGASKLCVVLDSVASQATAWSWRCSTVTSAASSPSPSCASTSPESGTTNLAST
jgi:hypothetical protein